MTCEINAQIAKEKKSKDSLYLKCVLKKDEVRNKRASCPLLLGSLTTIPLRDICLPCANPPLRAIGIES